MPACVAWGCDASSNNGCLFKIFPRKDLERCKIWIERVNRPGWTPNKHSVLCERHFDNEQWEVLREDGKRKLKDTALPTIFCVEYPCNDDIVAKEHSYCMLGYRQLYDSTDTQSKYSSNDHIAQFERIKVDVDESSVSDAEKEQIGELAEDIQCTPDIYSEPNEPDPIEMVQCETTEPNINLSEPCSDPLAISQEELDQLPEVVPNFKHSQKFVFIAKEKYMVPSISTDVPGEPTISRNDKPRLKVLNPEQKDMVPSMSPDGPVETVLTKNDKPRIKVLSPEQLFYPSTLKKRESSLKTPGSSDEQSPTLDKTGLLRQMDSSFKTPVSSNELLTEFDKKDFQLPIAKKVCIIPVNGSSYLSRPNIKVNSQSVKLSKTTLPPLTRRINISGSLIAKSVSVNGHSITPRPLLPSSNLLSESVCWNAQRVSPKPLSSSSEFLKGAKVAKIIPSKSNLLKIDIIKQNSQASPKEAVKGGFIERNLKSSPTLPDHVNKDLKIQIKSEIKSGFLKQYGLNVNKQSGPISNSVVVCEKLEKAVLDHEYIKPLWKPVSIDEMKLVKSIKSNKSAYRLLGNNDVKLWLTKNNISDKSEMGSRKSPTYTAINSISPRESGVKKLKGVSSVVVLNPYEKSKSPASVSSRKVVSNKQNVKLYVCAICDSSFLTLAMVKSHVASHSITTAQGTSNSTGTASFSDNDDEVIEMVNGQKMNNKSSDDERKIATISLEEKSLIISKSDSAINKISDNNFKNIIPANVKLKDVVIRVPKLNIKPEIKSVNRNKKMLMKKKNKERYSLRSSGTIKQKCGDNYKSR